MAVDGTSNDNTVHSSTINAMSPSLSSLTVESCSLAMSCIDTVKKDITLACANTVEKKRANLAHSKTTEAKSNARVQKTVMRGMNHVEKFATSLKNLGQRLTKSQTSKVDSGGESSSKTRKTSDTNTTSSQQSNALEDAVMGDVVNNQGTVAATSSTTPTEGQPTTIKVGDDFTFPPFTLEGAVVYTPFMRLLPFSTTRRIGILDMTE